MNLVRLKIARHALMKGVFTPRDLANLSSYPIDEVIKELCILGEEGYLDSRGGDFKSLGENQLIGLINDPEKRWALSRLIDDTFEKEKARENLAEMVRVLGKDWILKTLTEFN